MSMITDSLPSVLKSGVFGSATVVETTLDSRVRVRRSCEEGPVWARVVQCHAGTLSEGDEVLIAGQKSGQIFVIGVLKSAGRTESRARRVSVHGGAYAEAAEATDPTVNHRTLQVYSEHDELIFEYDPDSRTSRLSLDRGDVELRNPKGDLSFRSAGRIRLEGETIELSAHLGLGLSVENRQGGPGSSVAIGSRKLCLQSDEVQLKARTGEFCVAEMNYVGRKLSCTLQYARLTMGKLESVAKTVVHKAINVYRTVERLSQLQAGRVRTLVKGTLHTKSRQTILKTENDFKVKGDKIHLG